LLSRIFSKYGKIKRVKVIRDSHTNKSKGFGYVEFFDESSASNMLTNANPTDLLLKERVMTIRQFEIKVKPSCNRLRQQTKADNSNIEEPQGFNINHLPVDVLTNIFSKLCIRDLCIVEQGLFSFSVLNIYFK
jgi:RNA recognition motif-containing protein